MDSLLTANLKPLIIFLYLSGLAIGLVSAWVFDLYVLRKMHKSPVTKENIWVMSFISKVFFVCLAFLWVLSLSMVVYYNFAQPERLLDTLIWAKALIAIVLTVNGILLHRLVLPIISSNEGNVLVSEISLKNINFMTFTSCISFITWPFVMALGVLESLKFTFSFVEVMSVYLFTLIMSLAVAYALKSYLLEKVMDSKIRALKDDLSDSSYQLAVQQHDINILTKLLKQ